MSYVAGSELASGTTVAGYRIEALIGRGGMGAVYRAEEEGLGRKVALKVIAPELAQDERFRERFLRESQIAASLDHPHVIPIYQAGAEEGVLFLAMRYVEGTDLANLLAEEGALQPGRAVSLLEQIGSALDAAHERGLVHRDVKPSNVLISRSAGTEDCYLSDFGLTKRAGSLSGASAPGDVVGTLEYVAPEQITGDEIDARADLYSLACVFYECLTGAPSFPRATDVALLWAHVHEEPESPTKLRPELPKAIDGVLARALAKEPARRYASAGEFVAATRSALGLVETAAAPPSRLRWAVAAVMLALAVAAALFLLTRGSGGLSSVSPNSVGVIDPGSNKLVAEVQVGTRPEGLTVGEGAVWVTKEDGTVSRIDPETRRLVGTIKVDGYPSDVAVGDKTVWVAVSELKLDSREGSTYRGGLVVRTAETFVPVPSWFEPESEIVANATLGGLFCVRPAASVAVGTNAVWYACDIVLLRVDLRTRTPALVANIRISGSAYAVASQFSDLAFGLGSLWLADRATNTVTEIDPVTRTAVRPITVGQAPTALAVGSGSVWVANFDEDTVWRIEVSGRGQPVNLKSIAVGDGPVDVAASDDAVWVANSLDGTVSRIDPSTNEVVATIEVGNEPRRLAAGEGAVWVTVQGPKE